MDKSEDKGLNPDKVTPPQEAVAPPEEAVAAETTEFTEAEAEELQQTETPEAEAPQEPKPAEEVKETKKPADIFADEKKTDVTPFLLVAGVFGLAVVLLVVAWAGFWKPATAVYLSGLMFIPLLLWLGRKTNTVYVVLLGCVIAVLMTSVYLLWTVLARYHFDVKASEAKQRVGMVQPIDRGWQLASSAERANTLVDS